MLVSCAAHTCSDRPSRIGLIPAETSMAMLVLTFVIYWLAPGWTLRAMLMWNNRPG